MQLTLGELDIFGAATPAGTPTYHNSCHLTCPSRYGVTMTHTSAHDLINKVLDPDSFISWDAPPDYGSISPSYEADLARAREKSGVEAAFELPSFSVNFPFLAVPSALPPRAVSSQAFTAPPSLAFPCLSPPLRAGHACRKAAQHSP